MPIRCIIVEDEPLARRLLEQYVAKTPALELIDALANPLDALTVIRGERPELLFLDIQMPELTGISLLKVLDYRPLVVLTTAYSEYAIEGYALDVADYLLKPITFERFLQSVAKISARLSPAGPEVPAPIAPASPPISKEADFLFVKDGTKSVRLRLDEIQYIESLKDYVRIHTPERRITTLQSLKRLVELLPEDRFLRTHHSYIVGAGWIEEVQRDEVLVAGKLVPVSDTYRPAVKRFVEERELR